MAAPATRTTPSTLLLADGLKRILQTKQDAAVADAAGSPSRDSMIASGRVAFDVLGRTIAQYYPTASLKGVTDSAHRLIQVAVFP